MADFNAGLFQAMKVGMQYANQRQVVLSHNIANADTPAFKARDLKPLDFDKMVAAQSGKLPLMVTSPVHIQKPTGGGMHFASMRQRDTYETTPAGNNVVLEEQITKLAENSTDYQTATSLYRKMIAMIKTANGTR